MMSKMYLQFVMGSSLLALVSVQSPTAHAQDISSDCSSLDTCSQEDSFYQLDLNDVEPVAPPAPPPPPPKPVDCNVTGTCPAKIVGARLDNSSTTNVVIGENTETTVEPFQAEEMFSISVDGEHVAGTPVTPDMQRRTDLALEAADIQVKFDGLDVKPTLNVSTFPIRQAYQAEERVDFLATSNYPAWIKKSEVRIFRAGEERNGQPIYLIPVTAQGAASWIMPHDAPEKMTYVLRVTDDKGRFDETASLAIHHVLKASSPHDATDVAIAPGYGEDRTAIRNIQVYGGAVTIYGRNVPNDHNVTALGESVPVDKDNAFVMQRILPPGDQTVNVSVIGEGEKAKGFEFSRAINIPKNEWFYVGLADVTVGKTFGPDGIEKIRAGEFNDVYTKGRLAFYLKGKIKGKYLITAAADTGEDKIGNLFKGLDGKDPKQFLRRIDPNDYYPVYGDNSTTVDDAPTRGKFFIRLARGDSHAQWGNFKTDIKGTELLRNERALYGLSGKFNSESTTTFGERKTQATAYAAQPGTLPQRDELRGTGGSAYFLKHQDISIGSETVSIETRDRLTGRVINRTTLESGKDFDFDYLQGMILLQKPLPSSAAVDTVVQSGGVNNQDNYLIASYEYSPSAGQVGGYVFGGRAQQWIVDKVRVGATAQTEKTGAADQKLYGADVQLRHSERTYLEAEIARSQGPGFGVSSSTDGGLTISNTASVGAQNKVANAYRVHGHLGLDDFVKTGTKGEIDGYYDHTEAGFSSLGKQVSVTETNVGASAKIEVTERLSAKLSADNHRNVTGRNDIVINAEATIKTDRQWTFSPGVTISNSGGQRTDVGGKIKYAFDEKRNVYIFGQATISKASTRKSNDRIGVGGEIQLTEKLGLNVEASEGTSGLSGTAKLDFAPTVDDHYYAGYTLDADREYASNSALQGSDMGSIVAGATHAYNERIKAYTEVNSDLFGQRRSVTQVYGVKYTPDTKWTLGGGVEMGNVWDGTTNSITGLKNSDFDRWAISGNIGYRDGEKIDAHLKAEGRIERSQDGTRDLNSLLLQAGGNLKTSQDWRLVADVDAVWSEASTTTRSGRYAEASIGYAYRPTENDRLNALFKYAFLYDMPGADQLSAGGSADGPSQISNILTADFTYDLNEIVSVGGKYGARIGVTQDRAAGSPWEYNAAHLGVGRIDVHVVKNWDAMFEGRMMYTPEPDTKDFGALAAVYRQMGDNFKIGVGYNFGHFSDDLRSIGVDNHGIFVNAMGKF
jgi:hypothetical protein